MSLESRQPISRRSNSKDPMAILVSGRNAAVWRVTSEPVSLPRGGHVADKSQSHSEARRTGAMAPLTLDGFCRRDGL